MKLIWWSGAGALNKTGDGVIRDRIIASKERSLHHKHALCEDTAERQRLPSPTFSSGNSMSTSPELAFDWSKPCGELPEDSMGRAAHARNLTQLLIQKGQEGSYVLNLNAKWGAGKSYFLRRWVNEIQQTYPAVYIDAWSSDHSSDPLLSVVAEVKRTLHALIDISELEAELFQGVAKAVKVAAPAVVKAVLRGQLKKWTGMNPDDFSDIISEDDLADTGAKLIEEAIEAHNEATLGVIKIKESIQEWLASVAHAENRQYPMFIFIDELDRCRPTYAIEMLETIKHIFDMKNVVFVVATDKDQLQHSIRAIYGAGFDSRLYLDRFFTRTVTLSNPSRREFIARKIGNSEAFKKYMADDTNFAFLPSSEGRQLDMVTLLAAIADGFSWPLRHVNLWLDRLEAAIIMSSVRLEIIMLSFMMALETSNSEWLKEIDEGKSVFDREGSEVHELIDFKPAVIITTWSFSQVKYSIKPHTLSYLSAKLDIQHNPKISIVEFIKYQIEILKKDDQIVYEELTKEIEEVAYGREMTNDFFIIMDDMHAYPKVASCLYAIFHKLHGTAFSHYIEICRYSSLMS